MGRLNICFKVVGSGTQGLGHVRRSITLAQMLDKEHNVFCCANSDDRVLNYIKDTGINYYADNIEALGDIEIDVLVFDQPSDDIAFLELIRSTYPAAKIIALDYFNYNHRLVDVVINLFNQSINSPPRSSGDIEYLEGVEYGIIRENFFSYREDIYSYARKQEAGERITITFGGADPGHHTLSIIRLLEHISDIEHVDVVLGPLFESVDEVHRLSANSRHKIKVYEQISHIEKIMSASTLAFSGAGTTLLELCFLGVPTVIVPQTREEAKFAKELSGRGLVIYPDSSLTTNDIQLLIENTALRERIGRCGFNSVDGLGKDRIIKHILDNSKRNPN